MEIKRVSIGSYPNSYASYKIRDIDPDAGNFMINDIAGIILHYNLMIDKICEIFEIHVDPRDRGHDYGTELLRQILKETQEDDVNMIYLLRSGPLVIDYPEKPDDDAYLKELINQASWLEKHGFRNINSVCNFDESIPYLYLNDAATQLDESNNSLLKIIICDYELNRYADEVEASANVMTISPSDMHATPDMFIKIPKELGESIVDQYISIYNKFVERIRELKLGVNGDIGIVGFDVLREVGDRNIKLWDEGVSIKVPEGAPVSVFSAGITVNTGGCTWSNNPEAFIDIRNKLKTCIDETGRIINPDYDEYEWYNTDSDSIIHTLINTGDEYFFEVGFFVPDPNISYAHEEDNNKMVVALVLSVKPGKYFAKENVNNG